MDKSNITTTSLAITASPQTTEAEVRRCGLAKFLASLSLSVFSDFLSLASTCLSLVRLSCVLLSMLLVACVGLPENTGRSHSQYLPIDKNSEFAQRILAHTDKHIGKTGVYLLYSGQDAFVARLALTEHAKDSIDAQYYIWHDDIAGRLLLHSMYKAAQRGVRVRLLLDDNATKGMDYILSQFNAHPNIEVRLFNPYRQRKFRAISYLTDTVRINRRMHNKSFTADSLVSVIGGRNVGDEYFAADHDLVFADLDVSLIGAVVSDIQQDFDRYWASDASYPIEGIAKPQLFAPYPESTESTEFILNSESDHGNQDGISSKSSPIPIKNEPASKEFLMTLFDSKYPFHLADPDYQSVWAKAHFFSDPPSKVQQGRNFDFNDSVIAKVTPFIASTKQQLLIVSPYFVPTKEGTKHLTNMAKQNKRVIILTNSLAATDVNIVHAGYQKYRKELLEAGVELYEFKPDPKNDEYHSKDYKKKYKDDYDVNGILPDSDASLHAKAFAIDDRYMFVGSPNLDPRSATLNTELGVLFESRILAAAMNKAFEQNKNVINYQLQLSPAGNIEWHTIEDGNKVIYYSEPQAKLSDKVLAELFLMMPWLDSLL